MILVLRQLAHLRAMLHAGLVRAMAVAERRCMPQLQRRRLIGDCGDRSCYQKYRCANREPKSISICFHSPILKFATGKSDSAKGGESLVFGAGAYWRTVPVRGRPRMFQRRAGWSARTATEADETLSTGDEEGSSCGLRAGSI